MIFEKFPQQATFAAALCLFVVSLQALAEPPEEQTPQPQLIAVEGLETVELIALLAHPNELTRTRAHQELLRYLVVETGAPEFPDRLTRFQKYAPHACKARHEAQTLHILGLFAAMKDISSILIQQCLQSPSSLVRATILEIAHYSDNPVDDMLLSFKPNSDTITSYKIALRNLGTPDALKRVKEMDD